MISNELKVKLTKVYELVKNGATDGEKTAANKALERLLSKYNLEGIDLESIDLERYRLKYSTEMDIWLFSRLITVLLNEPPKDIWRHTLNSKEISFLSTYLDYITISTAFEYFKRHMKGQWNKFCAPNLKRCRSIKARNKRREDLKPVFFSKYVIASNLYRPEELTTEKLDSLSKQEREDRRRLSEIEGGKFHRQMTSGLLLEQ